MFIELTDHLRCPADHAESFLVLIPDLVRGREVRRGVLGCPLCHREFLIEDGVVRFGAVDRTTIPVPDGALVQALGTFLGLEGPGGYVGLIGDVAGLASPLGALLPGVHLGLANPPPHVIPVAGTSVLEAPRNPFKTRALRGAVLGRPFASDPGWARETIAAVLPGLRVVGAGPAPELEELELLAEAGGWWVGRRR